MLEIRLLRLFLVLREAKWYQVDKGTCSGRHPCIIPSIIDWIYINSPGRGITHEWIRIPLVMLWSKLSCLWLTLLALCHVFHPITFITLLSKYALFGCTFPAIPGLHVVDGHQRPNKSTSVNQAAISVKCRRQSLLLLRPLCAHQTFIVAIWHPIEFLLNRECFTAIDVPDPWPQSEFNLGPPVKIIARI